MGAAVGATALIIDSAVWRQAGQLGDAATVTVVQLLQKVQVAVGASAPAAAVTSPAPVVVPNDTSKGKGDKNNGRDDDD